MHPHLNSLLTDLDRNTVEFGRLTELPEQVLRHKPDPRRWSVIEVIEHLRVTGEQYYPALAAAIERAHAVGGNPNEPYRPSLFARFFIHMAGPNSKARLKAPALFKPTPAFEDISALRRFVDQQAVLRDLLVQADGCNLNRTRFPSPISNAIKFTVGAGLTLMVRHQQRHWLQIQRLRSLSE